MAWKSVDGDYFDDQGNTVEAPEGLNNVLVNFKGTHNKLIIAKNTRVKNLKIDFPSHGAVCLIGNNQIFGQIRVGYHCLVAIGNNVTCTSQVYICSAEKTRILIGDDCMLATGIQIRSDDAHAIYDVVTEKRVNPSRDIIIGTHVWLAFDAVILSGSHIGEGSVVGFRSVIKGRFPNNVVIAGAPAKIIKKNIAWERPHVMLVEPWIREDASLIKKNTQHWNITHDLPEQPVFPGQGCIDLLSKAVVHVLPLTYEHIIELDSIAIEYNRLFVSGIAIIKGIACAHYSMDFSFNLLLRSERFTFSKKLAKTSDPNLTRKFFNGEYISYDKGRFCTPKNGGLALDDLLDDVYELHFELCYLDKKFYKMLTCLLDTPLEQRINNSLIRIYNDKNDIVKLSITSIS